MLFFFKRKTAYEMRISDWSSDVCSSDLRAQLFSAEQMERHGRVLAQAHRLSANRSADLLLARLSANEAVIERASRLLSEAAHAQRRLTPAGDWLLDNLYLIEEQVRIARRHLPKGYSRELPRLDRGQSDRRSAEHTYELQTLMRI